MVIIMTLWIGNGAVLKSSSLELLRTAPFPIHKLFLVGRYWDFNPTNFRWRLRFLENQYLESPKTSVKHIHSILGSVCRVRRLI